MTFFETKADFINAETPGFTVGSWTPAGGQAQNLDGVLSREYRDDVGGVGISGYLPTFFVYLADAPAIAEGDQLVAGGTTYTVIEVEPDELRSFATLILMET